MPTTADYLTDLTNQRDALAANLAAKGVAAANTEKFGTLVPKVLNINKYNNGVFTPASNIKTLSISGFSEVPHAIVIYVIGNTSTITVTNEYHISIIVYETPDPNNLTANNFSGFLRALTSNSPTYKNWIMNWSNSGTSRYFSYSNGTLSIDFTPYTYGDIVFSGGTTYKWVSW